MEKSGIKPFKKVSDVFIPFEKLLQVINAYGLYMRAEQDKKASKEKRIPIPYYLIDSFAKYECEGRNPRLISEKLKDSDCINSIIDMYTKVLRIYTKDYFNKYGIEYNRMIKRKIEYDTIEYHRENYLDV